MKEYSHLHSFMLVSSTSVSFCCAFEVRGHNKYPNIQISVVADEQVESEGILLEKIKSNSYFSKTNLLLCGNDGALSSDSKFVHKIKATINKPFKTIELSFQAFSPQEVRNCLNTVFNETQKNQNELVQSLIAQKTRRSGELRDNLKKSKTRLRVFQQPRSTITH